MSSIIGNTAGQLSGFGKFAFQTFAHAHLGGVMNGLTGGDYLSGFVSGGTASIVAGGTGKLLNGIKNPYLKAGGITFSGAVSGGAASVAAGGNFWDGFRNGLISAGLNHAAHLGYRAIQKAKSLVVGIYGAGGENAGDNPTLRELIIKKGGKLFHHYQKSKILQYILKNHSGKSVEIFGYSRGGNVAIDIANTLWDRGIYLNKLVTFDPHILSDNSTFKLEGSIRNVANFYQRNLRTGGKYGWWGSNPYLGSPIQATFNLYQQNFTGDISVNHLNIIRHALSNSDYNF